ncbi:MAG: SGNH/GDSL hydrolase family protein [Pseudomonadota bacterium]
MQKRSSCAVTLVALAGALCLPLAAHAFVVNQAFYFGDSLTDSGNAAALTQVAPDVSFFPPSAPSGIPGIGIPYDYRFTNGPVAAEYLSGLLGIAPSAPAWPAAPANPNSNFAVGGAMSGPGPTSGVPAPLQGLCCNFNWLVDSPAGLQAGFPAVQFTGLNNQVDLFASRLGSGDISPFDPATTMFSIWGGANDIFLALALSAGLSPADQAAVLQAYTINAALNIGLRIGELAALNGENFLVMNMPDLGLTPFAMDGGIAPLATSLAILFNATLDATLGPLRAGGLNIIEFDTFAALTNLVAGGPFANTTQPCFDGTAASIPTILGGCQGHLFFDGVHPTTATHQILAAQIYRTIPEPDMLQLVAAALLALLWLRRRERARVL